MTEKNRVGSACQVRVSPHNAITPNLGGSELAEALARVIPFTVKGKDAEARPILACIRFLQKDESLSLVSSDAVRLAEVVLPFEAGDGQACIDARDIRAIVASLRKAKRVRLVLNGNLDIMTEEMSYRWTGVSGRFPDLPPFTEPIATARLDSVELAKACASASALSAIGEVLLTITDGKVIVAEKRGIGSTEIVAETTGEAERLFDARYLIQALKACGAMVEIAVSEPLILSVNGYRHFLMPRQQEVKVEAKAEVEAEAQAEGIAEGEAEAQGEGSEAVVEAQAIVEAETDKPKRKRNKVAVTA